MKIFKESKKIAVTIYISKKKNLKFDMNKSVQKLNFTSDEKNPIKIGA